MDIPDNEDDINQLDSSGDISSQSSSDQDVGIRAMWEGSWVLVLGVLGLS